MFFIGCAQLHVKAAEGVAEDMLYLTRREKEAFCVQETCVDIFFTSNTPFAHSSLIGRAPRWFVDEVGNLMVAGELFFNHRETERILDDIHSGKARWGLALETTVELQGCKCVKKSIASLEITQTPQEDTWILKASATAALFKDLPL
jgi:hypothetical protein